MACALAAIVLAAACGLTAIAGHGHPHRSQPAARHAPTGGTSSVAVVGFVLTPQPQLQEINLAAVAPTPLPAATSAPAPDQPASIRDLGGPVQTAPRIYVVFVGSVWLDSAGSPTADAERTLSFFTDLGTSRYNAGLQQYRGAGTDVKLVAAWVDPVSNGGKVNPADDVGQVVQQEKIPAGDQTQVVAVYPPGYTFETPTESGLAAFHAVTSGVTFAAVSYSATTPGSLTQMLSHEYAETVTDPLVTGDGNTAGNPAFVAAANTANNYNELADLCQTQSGGSDLAAFFDRQSGRCVTPPLSA